MKEKIRIKLKTLINPCELCDKENVTLTRVKLDNGDLDEIRDDYDEDDFAVLEALQEGLDLCEDCLAGFKDSIKDGLESGAIVETTNIPESQPKE